jgi:hypothetical protein
VQEEDGIRADSRNDSKEEADKDDDNMAGAPSLMFTKPF